MNLTATASAGGDNEVVLVGVTFVPANATEGVMQAEELRSVSIRVGAPAAVTDEFGEEAERDDASRAVATLTWSEGRPEQMPSDEVFSVQLSADAPGVLIGSSDSAVVTVAKPHFVSIVSGGRRMVLKKLEAEGEKTFFQRWGSMMLIGIVFVVNMGVRAWLNSGGSVFRSVKNRDTAEEKRAVTPLGEDETTTSRSKPKKAAGKLKKKQH